RLWTCSIRIWRSDEKSDRRKRATVVDCPTRRRNHANRRAETGQHGGPPADGVTPSGKLATHFPRLCRGDNVASLVSVPPEQDEGEAPVHNQLWSHAFEDNRPSQRVVQTTGRQHSSYHFSCVTISHPSCPTVDMTPNLSVHLTLTLTLTLAPYSFVNRRLIL
ncbi:unnamed protein product, partial [Protopolystoma xenopodis]